MTLKKCSLAELPDVIHAHYADIDTDDVSVEWVDEDCVHVAFSEETVHVWVRQRGTWRLRS